MRCIVVYHQEASYITSDHFFNARFSIADGILTVEECNPLIGEVVEGVMHPKVIQRTHFRAWNKVVEEIE